MKQLAKFQQQISQGISPQIGNSEQPLNAILTNERLAAIEIDYLKRRYKIASKIGRCLLAPEAEAAAINQATDGPAIFGASAFIHQLSRIDHRDHPTPILLNIGMSGNPEAKISAHFPAYLELGLQRAQELQKQGHKAKIRFFSTASLSPRINGSDPKAIKDLQAQQKALAENYVHHFYPDLAEQVNINNICLDIPEQADVINQIVAKIKEKIRPDVLKALENCGLRYSSHKDAAELALAYAAYHCVPETFLDPRKELDEQAVISVGGPGEALFNEIRFKLIAENRKRLGIVIGSKILSKTPPYLHQEGEANIQDLLQPNGKIDAFLRNPLKKSNRHNLPGSRDLLHLGRCLCPEELDYKDKNREKRIKVIQSGLDKLREFYQHNL